MSNDTYVELHKEIKNPEFQVHKVSDEGFVELGNIGLLFDGLLTDLKAKIPNSRLMSMATTKLEEACFFAKKALAETYNKV